MLHTIDARILLHTLDFEEQLLELWLATPALETFHVYNPLTEAQIRTIFRVLLRLFVEVATRSVNPSADSTIYDNAFSPSNGLPTRPKLKDIDLSASNFSNTTGKSTLHSIREHSPDIRIRFKC